MSAFIPSIKQTQCCLDALESSVDTLTDRVTATEDAVTYGNATLVGGTIAVADTSVTADSVVVITCKTAGGTPGTGVTYTLSAGVGFTITSTSGTDTSVYSYAVRY